MNDELKPCPFCGEQPEVSHYETFDNDEWYIGCDCECGPSTKSHLTYEQAIADWNARAERTCYADEVTHRDCKYSVNRGWKERTCRNDKDKWSGLAKYLFVCSECGWNLVDVGNDAIDISARLIKRCPMCGAKVVDE